MALNTDVNQLLTPYGAAASAFLFSSNRSSIGPILGEPGIREPQNISLQYETQDAG